MSLLSWMWIFLIIYMVGMFVLGLVGAKKTTDEDSYATARKSYNYWVVGLCIAATYASGALFMGGSGMAYGGGFPVLWYALLFPLGTFTGMMLFARMTKAMHKLKIRTLGEYLGDRFQSEFLRLVMGVVSLFLLFLIGAQVISAGTIFSMMMGIPYEIAIWLGTAFILIYITFGGAHADFLTDSVQAVMMVIVAVILIAIAFTAPGLHGGIGAINDKLVQISPEMGWNSLFNSKMPQFSGGFIVAMILFTTIPFAIQPQSAVKFMGLNKMRDIPKAIMVAAVCGFLFQFAGTMAGITARVLVPKGVITRADMALPALLQQVFGPFVTALLCMAILAAVMSTVDGVFLSLSQVFANDVYRKSIATRAGHSEEQIERNCKWIARIVIIVVGIAATAMVIKPPQYLMMWLTLGGSFVFACVSGVVIVGAMWRGVTKSAVLISFILSIALYWYLALVVKVPSMSIAGIVFIFSLIATFVLSKVTKQTFTDEHLEKFFGVN